jgi:aryl-alcohol dehydrogenase-like predicted oxidoreductase
MTAPIIGARTADQLRDNLGATGWELPDKHDDLLSSASAGPLPYPHRFLQPDDEDR